MSISVLTVRIEFDHDNRPAIINELFDHFNVGKPNDESGGYVVTAASWLDPMAELEELEEKIECGELVAPVEAG